MSNTADATLTDPLVSENAEISQSGQEDTTVRVIDIHVYDFPPVMDDTHCIETTLQEEVPAQPSEKKRQKPIVFLVLLLLLVVCVLTIVGSLAYPVLFPPMVTITIVPESREVQTISTVTIVAANADPTRNQIEGRSLPTLTMSQSQTNATTGTTYQEARPGRGTITFYNAALSPQTIVAGTLITGKDGRQVVTDMSVTVPAESFPTLGVAKVSAHAVQPGPDGNIKAGDIYGPCCLLTIQAVSSAFAGGEAAQTYQSVSQQDIDTTVVRLQTSLTQSASASLGTQVKSSETLVTPLTCETHSSTDHEVGDKATWVQVTVSQTCTTIAYETQALQQRVRQAQTQAADNQQREHYQLSGIQVMVQKGVPGNQPGTYLLTVLSRGTWVYQFSPATLEHLATSIAGKGKDQATQLLLHTAGIQQVSLSTENTLPSDPQKIRFLFLTQQ